MYQRIAVGFDGSDPSRRALQAAVMLGQCGGAELVVILIQEHVPRYPEMPSEVTEEREAIDRYFVTLKREAETLGRDAGLSVTAHVGAGNAPKLLCDIAKREKADLLVIGVSGRSGGLWGNLLGSTADKVVDHAPCSVLVVRGTPR